MSAIIQSIIASAVSTDPYITPTNLSVTTSSPNSLSVTWKDNSVGESGFQLQYMLNDLGIWVDAPVLGGIIAGANAESASVSYTWTQFSKLDFRIRAVGPLGESGWSPTFTLITPGTEPFNFYVEHSPNVGQFFFTATWQEVSNAETYHRIEVRRNNGEFVYAADAPANATSLQFQISWQDFDALAFRIKAVGIWGESAWSELRFLNMPGFTAPTNLAVTSYDNTTAGSVTLTWDAYPTPVTGFSDPKLRVERRAAGGPWFSRATALAITATTFTDTNTSDPKESSTTYEYRVIPTQGGFVSKNASNIVSITTPFLYSRTYMESESLITFLRPQLEIPTGPTIPPVPKIMISAANNSFQRVYTLLTGTTPNRFFRARFEGASTSFPTAPGNSNMEWEIVFSEALPNRIDIHIGQNGREFLNYKGLSGVYSESALIAEIQNSPFGLANVAFRIETTAGAATVTQIPLALLGGFSMNKIYEGHQNSSFRQLEIPWPVSYLGTNY